VKIKPLPLLFSRNTVKNSPVNCRKPAQSPSPNGVVPLGTVEHLTQGLLAQQSVMIVPAHLFSIPGNHFRIGLGRKNFGEALGRVDVF
jgi:hypothetical protein